MTARERRLRNRIDVLSDERDGLRVELDKALAEIARLEVALGERRSRERWGCCPFCGIPGCAAHASLDPYAEAR